ncbi:hypothetical protein HMPREF1141_0145 [Clostridium sp. MSTE9]|nr:hypothetical protein HMPREF1141_0145 [Clostridium sp. MSTE9]
MICFSSNIILLRFPEPEPKQDSPRSCADCPVLYGESGFDTHIMKKL